MAPLRQLIIPKLELQAAVMCTRLLETVKKKHTYPIDSFHLWSDSQTVIQWIHNCSRRHPTFIANRVAEIQDSTDPDQWRHVPDRLNVADERSRGMHAQEIHAGCRWITGPAFLSQPEKFWPQPPEDPGNDDDDLDQSYVWTNVGSVKVESLLKPDRFVSWNKLLRVTSYVLRFVHNCRKKKDREDGPFSISNMAESKDLWIKISQRETFEAEKDGLTRKTPISRQNRLLTLSAVLDSKDILRAGGSISKTRVPYSTRHPVVLSPKSDVTRLSITDYHLRYHHEGNEHVRNLLQEEFWILNCRATLPKFTHQCPYCRRRRVLPQVPVMTDLPFSLVGVDYFGPFADSERRKRGIAACSLV